MANRMWVWGVAALVAAGCKGGDSDSDTDPVDTDTDVFVAPDVVINELVAGNTMGLQDASGAFPDWVELYNAGDEIVDLSTFTFTDDPLQPQRWSFPTGTTIAAGGYLILFADGDPSVGDEVHTNFSLSRLGEALQLVGPASSDLAIVDEVVYGIQTIDHAWARMPDGGDFADDATPTPGEPNG
jgi:hypothetical protein